MFPVLGSKKVPPHHATDFPISVDEADINREGCGGSTTDQEHAEAVNKVVETSNSFDNKSNFMVYCFAPTSGVRMGESKIKDYDLDYRKLKWLSLFDQTIRRSDRKIPKKC